MRLLGKCERGGWRTNPEFLALAYLRPTKKRTAQKQTKPKIAIPEIDELLACFILKPNSIIHGRFLFTVQLDMSTFVCSSALARSSLH